jgi:hypothetical protein
MLIRMDWSWHSVWQGVLSNAIYALLIFGVGVLLTLLKQRGSRWVTPIVYGLGASALVAVILLAFVAVTRIPKEQPQITPDNVEANIRTWLDASGISTRILDEPDRIFALGVMMDSGTPVEISRPKSSDRYIIFQTKLVPDDDRRAQLDKLSGEEKDQLVQELELEMARAKVSYIRESELKGFTMIRGVPINALTESIFNDKIGDLDFAHSLARQTIIVRLDRHKAKAKQ